MAELDASGVALYSDQQAIVSTTPIGRAMIQMASVFGEQDLLALNLHAVDRFRSVCVEAFVEVQRFLGGHVDGVCER